MVEPSDRATLGAYLFDKLSQQLPRLGASHAWVLEYKADASFLQWWEGMGFEYLKEFLLDDGTPVVELTKKVGRLDETSST